MSRPVLRPWLGWSQAGMRQGEGKFTSWSEVRGKKRGSFSHLGQGDWQLDATALSSPLPHPPLISPDKV